jgi:hypothetical protein
MTRAIVPRGVLKEREPKRYPQVGTGHIDTLVPAGFVTVGCHGDSGGPLFGFSAGFQVALGLYTEFNPDNGLACPITSATQTFARLRTKITFIESIIGRCQRSAAARAATTHAVDRRAKAPVSGQSSHGRRARAQS